MIKQYLKKVISKEKKEKIRLLRLFVSHYLLHIIKVLYFNFKYLPFKQAVKLPIWINYRYPARLKGKVIIEADKVYSGMIQIGQRHAFYHYRKGVSYDNRGGTIIFKGKCLIGNESQLFIGKRGVLTFGDNFGATSTRFLCMKEITFKENVSIGFDTILMDSDFHSIKDLITGKKLKAHGKILIGSNTWIGAKCFIQKNTVTPDYCVIGANSVLKQKYKYPNYSIIAGNPAALFDEKFFFDKFDNSPED